MLTTVFAAKPVIGALSAVGLVLGAATTGGGGGSDHLLGIAAIMSSTVGLIGTVYTIVRGERKDRRRREEDDE